MTATVGADSQLIEADCQDGPVPCAVPVMAVLSVVKDLSNFAARLGPA